MAALIRVLGRAVRRQALGRRLDEALDRVGEMNFHDRAVAAGDAQIVRGEQDVGVRVARGRLELVTGELDQEPERILEVDRVHEHSVANGRLDPARLEPLDGLCPDGARDVEGDVMHAAGVGRRTAMHRLAVLAREHGDEPPVPGIEIDVALVRIVEIGLLENERHAEHALPEVDRGLAIGADQRDVMHTLRLKLFHWTPPQTFSTSLDLYSLRGRAPGATSVISVATKSLSRRRARMRSARPSTFAPTVSSTLIGSGGSCLTPAARGRITITPATAGANSLMTSRTAEGKTLTPRTISMSSVRPMQRTRGLVRPQAQGPMFKLTWSRVRKRRSGAERLTRCVSTSSPSAPSASGMAAPVSGSISSKCPKLRPLKCMPAFCSHSPQRDTEMSPMPIASVTLAPHPASSLARIAGSPPPGSPATITLLTLDCARSLPHAAAHSARCRAYEGVIATTVGLRSSTAATSRSVFPDPTGIWQRPSRSNAPSAAPATNGPAL